MKWIDTDEDFWFNVVGLDGFLCLIAYQPSGVI